MGERDSAVHKGWIVDLTAVTALCNKGLVPYAEHDLLKYPETQAFRNVVSRVARNHVCLPKLLFRGTVKADGTHADIVVQGDQTWFQSRNRIITEQSDNQGFAQWAAKLPLDQLLDLIDAPNGARLKICGEWCGQGIARKVAVCYLPRFWMIFGIQIDDTWVDMAEYKHVHMPEHRVFNAREFGTYDREIDFNKSAKEEVDMDQLVTEIAQSCPIGAALGCKGRGEGIVWTPADTSLGSKYFFKVKSRDHSTVDHDQLTNVSNSKANAGNVAEVQQFVTAVVTEARLLQGIDYLCEMGLKVAPENMGTFLQWVSRDVLKEDGDLMDKYGVKPEQFKKAVPKHAKPWFSRFVLASSASV